MRLKKKIESLPYSIKSGYRRVKRFIAWFPIIWKDEDWQPEHLFEIMRFKISRMRKSMETNKIIFNYQKYVRQMKVAEELLSLIGCSDFYDEWFDELQKRESQGKCAGKDICTGEMILNKPYLEFKRCNFCDENLYHWFKKQSIKQQEDFEFLFSHLRKHVKKWWD